MLSQKLNAFDSEQLNLGFLKSDEFVDISEAIIKKPQQQSINLRLICLQK